MNDYYANLNRRLDPRDPWDAAYLAESKRLLAREKAWQDAEIAKGSEIGLALAAARRKLGIAP